MSLFNLVKNLNYKYINNNIYNKPFGNLCKIMNPSDVSRKTCYGKSVVPVAQDNNLCDVATLKPTSNDVKSCKQCWYQYATNEIYCYICNKI